MGATDPGSGNQGITTNDCNTTGCFCRGGYNGTAAVALNTLMKRKYSCGAGKVGPWVLRLPEHDIRTTVAAGLPLLDLDCAHWTALMKVAFQNPFLLVNSLSTSPGTCMPNANGTMTITECNRLNRPPGQQCTPVYNCDEVAKKCVEGYPGGSLESCEKACGKG